MRQLRTAHLLTVATLALSGCVAAVPPYVPPAAGPTAVLELETTVTVNSRHAYVSNTGSCAARAVVKSPGEVRVPAGKPLLVQQGFFSVWVASTRHCNIALTFVPLAGQRYVASYQMDGKTSICEMNVWRVGAGGARLPEATADQVNSCAEP